MESMASKSNQITQQPSKNQHMLLPHGHDSTIVLLWGGKGFPTHEEWVLWYHFLVVIYCTELHVASSYQAKGEAKIGTAPTP